MQEKIGILDCHTNTHAKGSQARCGRIRGIEKRVGLHAIKASTAMLAEALVSMVGTRNEQPYP